MSPHYVCQVSDVQDEVGPVRRKILKPTLVAEDRARDGVQRQDPENLLAMK